MIDAEKLLYTLLDAGKPAGSTVAPETNLDSVGDLPLALYHLTGSGQNSNGAGLWSVTLDLSVIDADMDGARAAAAAFYDLVWSWDSDPATAIVPGIGWVSSVSDVSLFSRTPSPDVDVRDAIQYDGAFGLELRNQ